MWRFEIGRGRAASVGCISNWAQKKTGKNWISQRKRDFNFIRTLKLQGTRASTRANTRASTRDVDKALEMSPEQNTQASTRASTRTITSKAPEKHTRANTRGQKSTQNTRINTPVLTFWFTIASETKRRVSWTELKTFFERSENKKRRKILH